jgi:hypothetical protein
LVLINLFCGDLLFGTISSQRSRKVPLWHTGLFFLVLINLFCGDSLFGTISSQRSRKVPLWHLLGKKRFTYIQPNAYNDDVT